jgi:hypothetical protein
MMMAYVNFHLFVQAVVHNKTVGHSDTVRLHGMASIVGVVSDIRVVEVGDFLWLSTIGGARRVQRRTILGRVGHGSGSILDGFCRVRIWVRI